MPPLLALILCLFLIYYLFHFDIKQKHNVSSTLWITLLWILILGSKPIALWLNPAGGSVVIEDVSEGSAVDRTIFIILMLLGLWVLSKRKINWAALFSRNRWLVLFFLFGAVSIIWSEYPFVAFKRWIRGIGSIMMVLIVLTEADPVEAVTTLIRRTAYVFIPLSIVLIKYYPGLGTGYEKWTGMQMFTGVTTTKNELGRICMICGFYFCWSIYTKWREVSQVFQYKYIHIVFLLMIFWLFAKANSATASACFVTGLVLIVTTGIPVIKRNLGNIGIYFVITISIFFLLDWTINIRAIIFEFLGRNVTLTDRTYIWQGLLSLNTNPWIGSGYESFWLRSDVARLLESWPYGHINESHNGYLEMYFNQGFIGLFLFSMVAIAAYRNSKRELLTNFTFGQFKIALFVMILIYNYTEAGFRNTSMVLFFFLILSLFVPSRPGNQVRENVSPVLT